MKIIIEDKREIIRIELFTYYSSDIVSYTSRENFKIIPYHENGEMAPIVWFAIERDGKIVSRVNSKYVQVIEYKD